MASCSSTQTFQGSVHQHTATAPSANCTRIRIRTVRLVLLCMLRRCMRCSLSVRDRDRDIDRGRGRVTTASLQYAPRYYTERCPLFQFMTLQYTGGCQCRKQKGRKRGKWEQRNRGVQQRDGCRWQLQRDFAWMLGRVWPTVQQVLHAECTAHAIRRPDD